MKPERVLRTEQPEENREKTQGIAQLVLPRPDQKGGEGKERESVVFPRSRQPEFGMVAKRLPPSFLDKLTSLSSCDAIRIERPYVLASLMEIPARNVRVLHVLNYADGVADELNITLADLACRPGEPIRLVSPDGPRTTMEILDRTDRSLALRIRNLDTYAVILLPSG